MWSLKEGSCLIQVKLNFTIKKYIWEYELLSCKARQLPKQRWQLTKIDSYHILHVIDLLTNHLEKLIHKNTTHNINLGKFPLKQWFLKLGHCPHNGVVLGHDCLESCGCHSQFKRVAVSQQLFGRFWNSMFIFFYLVL